MDKISPDPDLMLARVDFERPPPSGEYTRPAEDAPIEEANLLTSRVSRNNRHKVVIDLDMPAQLIASSTPGHYHLIIDHQMRWSEYLRLLETMAEVGLIEPGYCSASIDRGYTAVRLPWVRKDGEAF